MTSTASSKDLCMGLLTVRLAQLQLDVGLGLGTLLLVSGIGGDLVNVNDKSGHGFVDLLVAEGKNCGREEKGCGQMIKKCLLW